MHGNSNLGYRYGTDQLSEEEKRAFVEYMRII
ncbi:MAG: hypothetical protein ACJATN_002019 [Neolewinella sp.]|jgi:hypothetical protein